MTKQKELPRQRRELFHPCQHEICGNCGNIGHPYCAGRVEAEDEILVCSCYCHEMNARPQPAEDEREPRLEDLAIQAAAFLETIEIPQAKHIAFALRSRVKSSQPAASTPTEAVCPEGVSTTTDAPASYAERVRQLLESFMGQPIPDSNDYDCDICRMDSQMCRHWQDALINRIATLVSTVATETRLEGQVEMQEMIVNALGDVKNPCDVEGVDIKSDFSGGFERARVESIQAVRALSPDPHYGEKLKEEAWQPIETAPKDGTAVLILFTDGAIAKARWEAIDWDEWLQKTVYDWTCISCVFSEHDKLPTHWMAIPYLVTLNI